MSIAFLEFFLALPAHRQMRHWSSNQPWKHKGKQFNLPGTPVVESKNVTLDASGNITRLTKTVLRPCFGSPTAYLLLGGKDFQYDRNGELRPTRCGRCKARPGCEYTAKARLRVSADVRDAYDAWEAAGGRDVMLADRRSGISGSTAHRWADLLSAFDRHGPFNSVNDQRIRDYVHRMLEDRRARDAARQQKLRDEQRQRAVAVGEFDDEFLESLKRQTIHRRLRFDRARKERSSHRWLYQCRPETAIFTAVVWQARILLMARGAKSNASSIAAELMARKLDPATNHNVLRGRVKDALARIDKLERTTLPGWSEPIWEKLGIHELLTPEPVLG